MHCSKGEFSPAESLHFLIIFREELYEGVDEGLVLAGVGVVGLAILGAIEGLLLGVVLLLEDVEVCVDAVICHRLSAEEFVEVVPLGVQAVVAVVPRSDDADEAVHDLQALLLLHFIINFHKPNNITLSGVIQMLASLFGGNAAAIVQKYTTLEDPQVIPHLANMLASLGKTKNPEDIVHLSNLVKQTEPRPHQNSQHRQENILPSLTHPAKGEKEYLVRKFSLENPKLQWAGVTLLKEEAVLIDGHLSAVAERHKAREIRFWGKVVGIDLDYYVLQGVVGEVLSLEETPKGAEKRGEGANYYTYWVANNLLSAEWIELPQITPNHVRSARKIKRYFSGHLDKPLDAEPAFPGVEKHYLKAQLVRMTHSLELAPKGLLKPNDENPKVVEYEDEPKVPEFAELVTLQSWTHRNQNVLNLGRCTHYIDPSLPEDQIEAATAELAEKDPEIQRLRGITEDKLPEGSPLGVENVWQLRVVGDSQVFQKDEASNVYGIVVLKNLYWPGWVTIGYKSGFTNFYNGTGHKWTQPGWNQYENATLAEQAEDVNEYHEPNPKEEPKPAAEPAAEEPAAEE